MEPPSCDSMGAEPPTLTFLALRAYKNHYSVIRGYFRFKKLSRNRHFRRYRVFNSGGSSIGHFGQCPPKENAEIKFLHSD